MSGRGARDAAGEAPEVLGPSYQGLVLDAFQRDAMEAIAREEDVIVAAPTGAGKTLIAHYAIERALATGRRAIYTAPIKALSNQKYRDLSEAYPGKVGISTGDVSINAAAPVVIMTTEIFRNTIFEDPARCQEVGWVIFDEVHYLDDPERGTVWEESLIFAPPNVRVLALSATVSNLEEFAAWIRETRGSEVKVVLEHTRPVPLSVFVASTDGQVRPVEKVRSLRPPKKDAGPFGRNNRRRGADLRSYFERAQRGLVREVAERDGLPLLFFLFSRAACARLARACLDERLLASPEAGQAASAEFSRLIRAFDLDPNDEEVALMGQLVAKGIAYHHAGLLPALKEVIERLFTANHVRLLCATETFALGVNMPARSVAFEGIMKWNGTARVPLKTREFQQMAGRAGRRGIDATGTVYCLFEPERDEPGVLTSVVTGRVEPVRSQFNLSYGTLLNLYSHLGDQLYEACERSFANFKLKDNVRRGEATDPSAPPQHPLRAARARPARDDAPPAREQRGGSEPRREREEERGRGPGRQGRGRGRRCGPEVSDRDRGRGRGADPRAERGRGRGSDRGFERGPSRAPNRGGAQRDPQGRQGRGRGRRDERGPAPVTRRGPARRGEARSTRAAQPQAARGEGHDLVQAPDVQGNYRYAGVVEQVRLKMQILSELGHLDSAGKVTARGRFAMKVFGHEMEMTELVWSGALDRLSPEQIAVVATAVVFEPRTNVYYGGPDAFKLLGRDAYRTAQKAVSHVVELEEQRGIRQTCKVLEWELSGVVWAWVQGAEFSELRDLTDASDGDIVRTLRQTIQALRLVAKPLRQMGRNDLAHNIREAQRLLKRDLVDAEWQLRRGAELEGGTVPLGDDELESGEDQDLAPRAPEQPRAEQPPAPEPAEDEDDEDEFGAGLDLPPPAPAKPAERVETPTEQQPAPDVEAEPEPDSDDEFSAGIFDED